MRRSQEQREFPMPISTTCFKERANGYSTTIIFLEHWDKKLPKESKILSPEACRTLICESFYASEDPADQTYELTQASLKKDSSELQFSFRVKNQTHIYSKRISTKLIPAAQCTDKKPIKYTPFSSMSLSELPRLFFLNHNTMIDPAVADEIEHLLTQRKL